MVRVAFANSSLASPATMKCFSNARPTDAEQMAARSDVCPIARPQALGTPAFLRLSHQALTLKGSAQMHMLGRLITHAITTIAIRRETFSYTSPDKQSDAFPASRKDQYPE